MKESHPITKAVIAAAGYGTRFLPATKNQPKQMLPLIDKPIIQYLVEEAVASGITDIILVTQYGAHIMEDYFDNHYEIEDVLEKRGNTELLKMIRAIPTLANFYYVRQKKHLPYGNAVPILAVKDLIDDDEAFVYMFGDDVTISKTPVVKQLIGVYEQYHPSAILAVQEVPDNIVEKMGTVKYKENPKYPYEIELGVEKAPLGENPSNMAQFGRFVFTYDVVREIEKMKTGKNNELWVIDILNDLAQAGKHVLAQPVEGRWMTTGDPLAYLETTLELAIKRDDIKDELIPYLKNLVAHL